MAEDARRGLGRGLSALIGDEPAPSRGEAPPRASRTLPIAFLGPTGFSRARPSRPRILTIWPARSARRASCSPSWSGPSQASQQLRDRRRRTALARGADGQAARSAGGRARDGRQRGARARHRRERPARRPQRGGRGGRLSGADRPVRLHPGAARQGSRQEPQPYREHCSAPETARPCQDR